ncbi:galactose mutarotase [Priestia aryabhattai]|uniref:aldose epimerase family protein n=1 Tax=Priestia aryabhattai TaxID=412384 RepID=UPI00234E3FD7|nr:aldose epimerase family protein [Priestia aryabhattai]MDC7763704.1 galactose mutarotase [Priestia aryabhattai]
MKVNFEKFGELNNQAVHAYTLLNDEGLKITCLDYGCVISNIEMPDSEGKIESVVLGFDSIEEYQKYSPYFGAVVGRVAGRIGGAEFQLNDETYRLEKNEGNNHLHGGSEGFSHKIWHAKTIDASDHVGVEFTYVSKDGEEGYPGNLEVKVTYTLTNKNEFHISYEGTTDQDTLINLTNHTYFNLSGNLKETVLDHVLKLKSNEFLELNDDLLPTGETISVTDTPFDFREGHSLKEGVESTHPQNVLVDKGYDHPFLLEAETENQMSLFDPASGRKIEVKTDQPSVVLYTGNHLDEEFEIRGVHSEKYLGVCLETQGLPDAIHHKHFPSCVLKPGEKYEASTHYTFITDRSL